MYIKFNVKENLIKKINKKVTAVVCSLLNHFQTLYKAQEMYDNNTVFFYVCTQHTYFQLVDIEQKFFNKNAFEQKIDSSWY